MIIWIALLLLGLALIALFGVRGVRFGSSPHCRKCAYDLVGIDAPATCPECGRDLTAARAVRVGRWQRRPVLAGVGVALVLVGVTMAGYRFVLTTRTLPVAQRPTWLLKIDARSDIDARADEAIFELSLRRTKGDFSDKDFARFVDIALDRQADPSYAWSGSPFREVLVFADEAGFFSDAQRERYRSQVLLLMDDQPWKPEYRTTPDRETVTMTTFSNRTAPRTAFNEAVTMVFYASAISTDGRPVELAAPTRDEGGGSRLRAMTFLWGTNYTYPSQGLMPCEAIIDGDAAPPVIPTPAPGVHRYEIAAVVEWYLHPPGLDSFQKSTHDLREATPHRVRTNGSFVVKVIGEPSDVLTYIDSDAGVAVPSMAASLPPGSGMPAGWSLSPTDEPSSLKISGWIVRTTQADDAAFVSGRVHLRVGERLIPILNRKKDETVSYASDAMPGAPGGTGAAAVSGYVERAAMEGAKTVVVVIVPDPWIAAYDERAEVYWYEDIVFEGVPLDWSAIDANGADE